MAPDPPPQSEELSGPSELRRPLGLLLEELPAGSLGPHLAATSSGWVTVAATEDAGRWNLHSTFLPRTSFDATGERSAPSPLVVELGAAAAGLRRFSLHPTESGSLTLLQVHAGAEGEQLSWMALGSSGELESDRSPLARSPVPIVWETVLVGAMTSDPQVQGLALYAERHGDAADIYAVALRRGPALEPQLVAQEVRSWQAVRWQGQNALAVTRRHASGTGIELLRLDAFGKLIDAPTIIASEVDGAHELDLYIDEGELGIVWTEQTDGHSRLWGSLVGERGAVSPVRPLTPPRLTQSLIRSLDERRGTEPRGAHAALAWTEPDLSQASSPPVLVAPVGALDETLAIEHRGHDALLPALARAQGRTWGLFEGRECEQEEDCAPADLFAFSAASEEVGVQGLSPVLASLAQKEVRAAQAWDLTCAGPEGTCVALVADSGSPASVFVVVLSHLEFRPSSLVQKSPRVVAAAQTLMSVPELASLSVWAQPSEKRVYGGWLSFFDPNEPYRTPARPAPDGRRAPVRARLESFVLSALSSSSSQRPAAEPLEAGTIISHRARSLGGLAFAPAPGGGGVLAWAAIDGAEPQLFATLLDEKGNKVKQRMLTRQRGEVTDVRVVPVEGGWVFAWVGGPSGEEQVQTLLVDERLSAGTPVPISSAAVNPTGLDLIAFGDELVAVWADERAATQRGRSDLHLARLAADGTPRERPSAVVSKEAHLHSPRLAVLGTAQTERLALAYIEALPTTPGSLSSAGVEDLVARGRGRVHAQLVGEADSEVAWGPASTASFDWSCDAANCRIAGAAASEGAAGLWIGEWSVGQEPTARSLLPLRTRAAEAALPHWAGDEVVYADESEQGWVLRRARPNAR